MRSLLLLILIAVCISSVAAQWGMSPYGGMRGPYGYGGGMYGRQRYGGYGMRRPYGGGFGGNPMMGLMRGMMIG
ncbi:unnamed protein product [Cylicocyclus nassatus]|uniref:Uncharacterized protein n=1 Tax=Cylicocyclus nassatus TaxID=53992 RepID=A0AA36H3D9_CYLNA|nr:unnamed protein product [Cylicocyclus nassatus]